MTCVHPKYLWGHTGQLVCSNEAKVLASINRVNPSNGIDESLGIQRRVGIILSLQAHDLFFVAQVVNSKLAGLSPVHGERALRVVTLEAIYNKVWVTSWVYLSNTRVINGQHQGHWLNSSIYRKL